jgi:hypothetical protein
MRRSKALRGQRGRPVLANGELGAKIIERVDRLSRPYGDGQRSHALF